MKGRKAEDIRIPSPVIAISILGFIASFFFFILAVGFFAAYSVIYSEEDLIVNEAYNKLRQDPSNAPLNLNQSDLEYGLNLIKLIVPVMGMASLALMLLYLISSIFLLKRHNWARYLHIIISMFFILLGLLLSSAKLLLFDLPILIVNGFIAGYLLFSVKPGIFK